jgi:hypothetical protein
MDRLAVLRDGRLGRSLAVRSSAGEERDAPVGARARRAKKRVVKVKTADDRGVEGARRVAVIDCGLLRVAIAVAVDVPETGGAPGVEVEAQAVRSAIEARRARRMGGSSLHAPRPPLGHAALEHAVKDGPKK